MAFASNQNSAQQQNRYARLGNSCYTKSEKVNAELFSVTYGALVVDLVKNLENVEAVNEKLESMGQNIGVRLVDELLAKTGITKCSDFGDTAEIISKVGFKMFLNVTPEVTAWNEKRTCCTLVFKDNPLEDFVEIPSNLNGLKYCNILCGVLHGALEAVNLKVECTIVSDVLVGDSATEIRLTLKEVIEDSTNKGYQNET